MRFPTSKLKWLCPAFALLLAACGGGGGGGTSNSGPRLSIASNTVTFTANINDPMAPAARELTGSITNATSPIYLLVEYTQKGLASASVQITSGTTGEITFVPKAPGQLGLGTFQDQATLYASTDPGGANPIAGSPQTIQVTYTVTGLQAIPASVALTAFEGSPSASSTVNLSNATTSSWNASVDYGNGPMDWLSVTPSQGSSSSATLTCAGAAMTAGTYSAVVSLSAGDGSNVKIPVTYTVAANLGAAASSLAFTAVAGQPALPGAQNVAMTAAQGTIAYAPSISYGSGATGWLSVTGASAPGNLTVSPMTTGLIPGTYQAQINLAPTGGGTAVNVQVSYQLTAAALTVGQAPSFIVNAATPAGLQGTLTTGDTGAPLTWTAVSTASWLSVTPSGNSGTAAVLSIIPAKLTALPNGPQVASVIFTYSGFAVTSATLPVAVPLSLSLPTINYVAPYVGYTGDQIPVILRGSGFNPSAPPVVMFGSQPAVSVTVVNDTEIKAVPPPGSPAGTYPVSVANALGLARRTASYVVRDHPVHAYASLQTHFVIQNLHVIYDAERDAVISCGPWDTVPATYSAGQSTLNRFAYDATHGSWSKSSTYIANLWDIALSPDGKTLLALTTNTLFLLDPVTFISQASVPLSFTGMGTMSQMASLNDGTVILKDFNQAYSLVTGAFTALKLPGGLVGIDASPDGSRASMGFADNSGSSPIYLYDAATGQTTASAAKEYYFQGFMSLGETRFFNNGGLRDVNMAYLGGTPATYGLVSPDGTRVHAYDLNTFKIRSWRVTSSHTPPAVAM